MCAPTFHSFRFFCFLSFVSAFLVRCLVRMQFAFTWHVCTLRLHRNEIVNRDEVKCEAITTWLRSFFTVHCAFVEAISSRPHHFLFENCQTAAQAKCIHLLVHCVECAWTHPKSTRATLRQICSNAVECRSQYFLEMRVLCSSREWQLKHVKVRVLCPHHKSKSNVCFQFDFFFFSDFLQETNCWLNWTIRWAEITACHETLSTPKNQFENHSANWNSVKATWCRRGLSSKDIAMQSKRYDRWATVWARWRSGFKVTASEWSASKRQLERI